MSKTRGALVCLLVLMLAVGPATPAFAKDPQLVPKRISSVGDSITEAIDAELPGANHWASYSNGYANFWTWLFGLTNVNSHHQRIRRNFGSSGVVNNLGGVSGADSFDLADQTAEAVSVSATYVPWLMGHNDVCQDSFAQIPTDAQFEANARAGLDNLKNGLPNGATVYVLAIVDIKQLYEVGQDLQALGFLDCEVLWATTLLGWFPCGTMLSPLNSEADRLFTQSRNIAFNNILESLVAEYNANDPHHYYAFTDITFEYPFTGGEVSSIDCFHPNANGQTILSDLTWDDGPFAAFQR